MTNFDDSQYTKYALEIVEGCPDLAEPVALGLLTGSAMIAHAISDLAEAVQNLADNK